MRRKTATSCGRGCKPKRDQWLEAKTENQLLNPPIHTSTTRPRLCVLTDARGNRDISIRVLSSAFSLVFFVPSVQPLLNRGSQAVVRAASSPIAAGLSLQNTAVFGRTTKPPPPPRTPAPNQENTRKQPQRKNTLDKKLTKFWRARCTGGDGHTWIVFLETGYTLVSTRDPFRRD